MLPAAKASGPNEQARGIGPWEAIGWAQLRVDQSVSRLRWARTRTQRGEAPTRRGAKSTGRSVNLPRYGVGVAGTAMRSRRLATRFALGFNVPTATDKAVASSGLFASCQAASSWATSERDSSSPKR